MLLIVEPNPAVTSNPVIFIARQYLVRFVKLDITKYVWNCGIVGNLKIKNSYKETWVLQRIENMFC